MNEFQQNVPVGYGALAPQGFFGGLLGAPLGGLIGRGIGGLFGNPNVGGQIGQFAGGIGGSLLPFSSDPVAAAYAQQAQQQAQQQQLQQALMAQQLAQQNQVQQNQMSPQGWFGNVLGQIGQPLGSAIGGIFGNAGLGSTIGNVAGQLGRFLPFSVDPVSVAYAQQQLAQQGQLAPQGWFGNVLSQIGQPLGGAIGGIFGNAGLGSSIGNVAGQIGRLLPFNVDPISAAYAQQQLQQQLLQQQLQQQQLQQQLQQAQLAQQNQMNPQNWFGNVPNQAAQQFVRPQSFNADPVAAAYAQMAQLAQQQSQIAQQANGYNPAFFGGQAMGAQGGYASQQPLLH